MKGVYAGSFDPVTLGHLSVVERARSLFEELFVLIAIHPTKTPLLPAEQRVDLVREVTRELGNVSAAFSRDFTVTFARSVGARYLVRGIRDASDAEYETRLAAMNRELAPEITTLFVPADRELSRVSSSWLKRELLAGGDVSRFCHPSVEAALRERLRTERAG